MAWGNSMACQPMSLGLRATRRRGLMPSVPHTPSAFPAANATPNHALQRTATGCHAGCSPQSPPRSRRASPPPSLSLRSFGRLNAHSAK